MSTCKKCNTSVSPERYFTLRSCGHGACVECAHKWLVDEKKRKCMNVECSLVVSEDDLQELARKRTPPTSFPCPRCRQDIQPKFTVKNATLCPNKSCAAPICISCKQLFHDKKDCARPSPPSQPTPIKLLASIAFSAERAADVEPAISSPERFAERSFTCPCCATEGTTHYGWTARCKACEAVVCTRPGCHELSYGYHAEREHSDARDGKAHLCTADRLNQELCAATVTSLINLFQRFHQRGAGNCEFRSYSDYCLAVTRAMGRGYKIPDMPKTLDNMLTVLRGAAHLKFQHFYQSMCDHAPAKAAQEGMALFLKTFLHEKTPSYPVRVSDILQLMTSWVKTAMMSMNVSLPPQLTLKRLLGVRRQLFAEDKDKKRSPAPRASVVHL